MSLWRRLDDVTHYCAAWVILSVMLFPQSCSTCALHHKHMCLYLAHRVFLISTQMALPFAESEQVCLSRHIGISSPRLHVAVEGVTTKTFHASFLLLTGTCIYMHILKFYTTYICVQVYSVELLMIVRFSQLRNKPVFLHY